MSEPGGDLDRELRHAEQVLLQGEVEIEGRMPWSSNATFLVSVCVDDEMVKGVYKPARGERPLWDFPPGPVQSRSRRLRGRPSARVATGTAHGAA